MALLLCIYVHVFCCRYTCILFVSHSTCIQGLPWVVQHYSRIEGFYFQFQFNLYSNDVKVENI